LTGKVRGRAASCGPCARIETRANDSNNAEPMGKRMKKLLNVIKPQSQDDTAHRKTEMVPADDSRERGYTGHLANFYDEVVSCLRPAEPILLFGPGEAKGELRKRIERDKLDLRITRFENERQDDGAPNFAKSAGGASDEMK
jgi:hypothetical protein